MSDTNILEYYMILKCSSTYEPVLQDRILLILTFFPFFSKLVSIVVGFVADRKEIYYQFFAFGCVLNSQLNFLLTRLVIYTNFLPEKNEYMNKCGGTMRMPSWHAQHVFFFYISVIMYFFRRETKINELQMIVIHLIPGLVCISRFGLGFNTFLEVLMGSICGILFGIFYEYAIMVIVEPQIPWLISTRISKYLNFVDNILNNNTVSKKVDDCVMTRSLNYSTENLEYSIIIDKLDEQFLI
ncbi:hypothetical protein EON71_00115 [bacterium]|nr:MAG: hypothetical protein EON71_00115 [bacterium]